MVRGTTKLSSGYGLRRTVTDGYAPTGRARGHDLTLLPRAWGRRARLAPGLITGRLQGGYRAVTRWRLHGGGYRVSCDGEALTSAPGRRREQVEAAQAAGKKGLWLKVPVASAAAVGAAVRWGFEFHHAQPDYALLVRYAPTLIIHHSSTHCS